MGPQGFARQPSPLPFQGTQWSLPTQNLRPNPTLEPDLLLFFCTNLFFSNLTLSSAWLSKLSRGSEWQEDQGGNSVLAVKISCFRSPLAQDSTYIQLGSQSDGSGAALERDITPLRH